MHTTIFISHFDDRTAGKGEKDGDMAIRTKKHYTYSSEAMRTQVPGKRFHPAFRFRCKLIVITIKKKERESSRVVKCPASGFYYGTL
jgi:hypothetical protein